MITQFGLNGVWNYGEIYSGGRHLATYSFGTTNFFHADWLGTKRAMTGVNGTVSETCSGFPFGDGVNCIGTNWSYNSFTDDVHDPETNLEHTLFRQYSGTQGRWLTPDPAMGSAILQAPQSWNRYVYVVNNPTRFTDPTGLLLSPGSPWFGNCSVDGMSGFCGALGGNGMTACPYNNCNISVWVKNPQGDSIDGHWETKQFWAFANGGGYYSYVGPGALYYSADQAGQAATAYYQQQTLDDSRERGGSVYEDKNDGVFSYNYTVISETCTPGARCGTQQTGEVPEGTDLVGDWHDHPFGDLPASQFNGDRNASLNPNVKTPAYVGYSVGGDFGAVYIPRSGQAAGSITVSPDGRVIVLLPVCRLAGPAISGIPACE
jgi:RHS repeat-associated protein